MIDFSKEFPQLKEQLYLDHAGASLMPMSLLSNWNIEVSQNLYGNPHSLNSPASVQSSARIGQRHLSANHNYRVVFTKNTTQSLKIIAESIDWKIQFGHFCYLRQSHTSILGMREYVPWDRVHAIEADRLETGREERVSIIKDAKHFNVFVFPVQCNFSGERFPLSWIDRVKAGVLSDLVGNDYPWIVILDAASYLATTPLNLSEFPVDFVVFSFYKLFGFPTGIGALVGSKDALDLLKKRYFGGGTVDSIAWDSPWKILKNSSERFEDGTLPFLEILAIDHGYDFIERIGGWEFVQNHVFGLVNMALQEMESLWFCDAIGDKISLCEMYSSKKKTSIITFNILKGKREYVGYNYVSKLASLNGINLRCGVFCNPGAAAKALELSLDDVQRHHAVYQRKCGDEKDILEGKPTGAIRISFGLSNTTEDVLRWINFLKTFFIPDMVIDAKSEIFTDEKSVAGRLVDLKIYPIKSCGGYSASSWPINIAGLALDRHWRLVDENGNILTQKKVPAMALIRPIELVSPLCNENLIIQSGQDLDLCEESAMDQNVWFSIALGLPCRLVSCTYERSRNINNLPESKISFANEAQFLCISKKSFEFISETILIQKQQIVDISCFRSNFILDGNLLLPFQEEHWLRKSLQIGDQFFYITEKCERCSMICINQENGKKSGEPFITLAKNCKSKSKVHYGIFLQHDPNRSKKPYRIQIGMPIILH